MDTNQSVNCAITVVSPHLLIFLRKCKREDYNQSVNCAIAVHLFIFIRKCTREDSTYVAEKPMNQSLC